MKLVTIIYTSGVVVEVACDDYRLRRAYARDGESLEFTNPQPVPFVLGTEHIAAVWEGRIVGAHDATADRVVPEPVSSDSIPRRWEDNYIEPEDREDPIAEAFDLTRAPCHFCRQEGLMANGQTCPVCHGFRYVSVTT